MTERTSRDAATELETQDEAVALVMVDEFQRALMAVLAPGSPAEYADSCGRFEHVRGVLIAALAAASTPAPRGLGDEAERGPEGGEEMSPVGHALLLMQEAEERGSATLTAAECADMLEYLIAINDATPEAEREDAAAREAAVMADGMEPRFYADRLLMRAITTHGQWMRCRCNRPGCEHHVAHSEACEPIIAIIAAALRRAAPGAGQEDAEVKLRRAAAAMVTAEKLWRQAPLAAKHLHIGRVHDAAGHLSDMLLATPAPTGGAAGPEGAAAEDAVVDPAAPYLGLSRFLYRALMDAVSQAVCKCIALHDDDLPTEAWEVDYSSIVAKAIKEARRIEQSECYVCGDPMSGETGAWDARTKRPAHMGCVDQSGKPLAATLAAAQRAPTGERAGGALDREALRFACEMLRLDGDTQAHIQRNSTGGKLLKRAVRALDALLEDPAPVAAPRGTEGRDDARAAQQREGGADHERDTLEEAIRLWGEWYYGPEEGGSGDDERVRLMAAVESYYTHVAARRARGEGNAHA